MRRPGLHFAPHERDVLLLDFAVVKLAREMLVRGVVLGDDHQARRAAIEPVDDARPPLAADAAQIVHVVQERVDERAARVAGGRMHDHARRLVHDDQVAILVDDRQRQGFRARRRIDRIGNLDGDGLAGLHRQVRLGLAPVHAHVPVLDQALNVRSRLAGEDRDEEDVEPGAVLSVGHGERACSRRLLARALAGRRRRLARRDRRA